VAQTELKIGDAEEQSTDNQVYKPEKSDDNIPVFSKQLEKFMEIDMKGFDILNSKIHRDIDTWQKTLKLK
jgi:hypothetical protein